MYQSEAQDEYMRAVQDRIEEHAPDEAATECCVCGQRFADLRMPVMLYMPPALRTADDKKDCVCCGTCMAECLQGRLVEIARDLPRLHLIEAAAKACVHAGPACYASAARGLRAAIEATPDPPWAPKRYRLEAQNG